MRKPVRHELGLVLGHGQVMSNDQVGNDFALTLELERLRLEALALIQRGLDLVADRILKLEAVSRLRVQVGSRGSPA